MRIVIILIISCFTLSMFHSCQPDTTSGKAEATKPAVETKADQAMADKADPVDSNAKRAEAAKRQQIANNAGGNPNSVTAADGKRPEAAKPEKQTAGNVILPNACTLVPKSKLASILGVEASLIKQKDGSSKQSKFSRSCFFRWEQDGVPNSGVLLQVQKNPVPDEFDAWATSFIDAKKENGETDFSGAGEVFKYKDFANIGTAGAYNFTLGKYYFRMDNKYVCMIAFNLIDSKEDEQLYWAKKIGKLMANAL